MWYIARMKVGGIEVLTIHDVAERLGLDRTTLARQIRRGALKAEKSGKTWLITAEEVEHYRREHMGKPGRKPKKRQVVVVRQEPDAPAQTAGRVVVVRQEPPAARPAQQFVVQRRQPGK